MFLNVYPYIYANKHVHDLYWSDTYIEDSLDVREVYDKSCTSFLDDYLPDLNHVVLINVNSIVAIECCSDSADPLSFKSCYVHIKDECYGLDKLFFCSDLHKILDHFYLEF